MTPDQLYEVYKVAMVSALVGATCGSLIAVVIFQLFGGER